MEIEQVVDVNVKEALEEKTKALELLQNINKELETRVSELENALNERDLVIYNLAVKFAKS